MSEYKGWVNGMNAVMVKGFLVDNDIIAKNVEMSESNYWVYEQINSTIDLFVMDDKKLLYVTKIVCDNDVYEVHTTDNMYDKIFGLDVDDLILRNDGGEIISLSLAIKHNIKL